jgi:hypothetical protein
MIKEGIVLKLNQVCIGKRNIQCRRIPHNMSNQVGMHWAKKAEWGRAWKEEVGYAFMLQRNKLWKLPLEYAHITINFYVTRYFDRDGSFNAAKPLLDALKVNGGVGVIIDDSPKYIRLEVEQIKVPHRQDEHVEIIIK